MRITHHPILGECEMEDTFIYYDGLKIPAVTGEPVAAALLAAGVRIFRHTAKDRRPRGVFCGIGRCNDCKMTVDGVPNIRTCVTPVREGMRVETQYGLGGEDDCSKYEFEDSHLEPRTHVTGEDSHE